MLYKHYKPTPTGDFWSKLAFLVMILTGFSGTALSDDISSNSFQRAYAEYVSASSDQTANLTGYLAASRLAKECFEWSEFATNDTQLAFVASKGVAAARCAITADPAHPAGHLYLGFNLGQLARTRLLTALPMVREMERSFLNSIRLDEKFHYAAAHRSLGMLYTEAPRWPTSVGSRSRARKHFESAIELVPDYPDNHLSALEAYVKWGDAELAAVGMRRYRVILAPARAKYCGPAWAQAWKDWDARWYVIQLSGKKLLKLASE